MNLAKVFSKIVKAHSTDKPVTVVTDYENTRNLIKYVLTLPDAYVENVEITDEAWNGYADAYLLSLNEDGAVYCQPAILDNGNIARGDGLYLIDIIAIGTHLPEDFVIESSDTKIKLIGGD